MNNMILSYVILFTVLYSMRTITVEKSPSRLCITFVLSCVAFVPVGLLIVALIHESKLLVIDDDYFISGMIAFVLVGATSLTSDIEL